MTYIKNKEKKINIKILLRCKVYFSYKHHAKIRKGENIMKGGRENVNTGVR